MRVPITDKMKSFAMHFVDFLLFFATIRHIRISRAAVGRPRSAYFGDRDGLFRKSRKQLASGFKRIPVALLMLNKMIQDGRTDDEALSGLPDIEDDRLSRSGPPQTLQKRSFSQTRSS